MNNREKLTTLVSWWTVGFVTRKLFIFVAVLITTSFNSAVAQSSIINWTKFVVSDSVDGAKKHVTVDLDQDGDYDIVIAANPEGGSSEDDTTQSGKNVIWYENISSGFVHHNIDLKLYGARAIDAGDINGDGEIDVIAGSANDSSTTWYENDGSPADGGWSKYSILQPAPYNYAVRLFDIDADGNLDILDGIGDYLEGTNLIEDSVRWLENDGGDPPGFSNNLIAELPSPIAVHAADLDNDDDLDVVSSTWTLNDLNTASDERLIWWSQSSGSWTQEQVLINDYGGSGIEFADLDNDNDLDIIAAGWKNETIDWWRNNNGVFGSRNTIHSSYSRSRNAFPGDIDGDGDIDIVAAADADNEITWFENGGQTPIPSFTAHKVDSLFTYAYFASLKDMDGDGDLDIIGTAQNADELAIWESDLEDKKTIAAGTQPDSSYWNGKVKISFSAGTAGDVSVFFNAGSNLNNTALDNGIDHIASSGFYTISSDKSTYSASIKFSFSDIPQWTGIYSKDDLIICHWSEINDQWEILNNQSIDSINDTISITGLTSEFAPYSVFTLGSSTSDNSLPVELSSFIVSNAQNNILLEWETQSEIDNQGFEIWRKSEFDSTFLLISSYELNDELLGLGTSSHGKKYSYEDNEVLSGITYSYKLVDVDYSGNKHKSLIKVIDFVPDGTIKIRDADTIDEFALYPNYPNPFNSSTSIEFYIKPTGINNAESTHLFVYNMLGQRVRTLFSGELAEGRYHVIWDGRNESGQYVASTNYFCVLRTSTQILKQKMTYIK